jgi:hypothetical protein
MLLMCVLLPQPAWGAIAQPSRMSLTLDILQERLRSPVQIEGIRTVDLQRMVIDLRPENADFRDQFYRLIQAQLQRAAVPIGLDFSYSLIRGELNASELGLREPLYGQSISPMFNQAEQEQLERDRQRLSQLSQLSRSLLIQSPPAQLQITVIRGALKLTQTQFEGFANFTNTFFLGRVEAQGAEFAQDADWSEARFSQLANFVGTVFRRQARFRSVIFFNRARFNQAQFQGVANFQSSEFQATANFSQVTFQQIANFSGTQWQDDAYFAQQTHWYDQAIFNKAKFAQSLFLSEATFENLATFREAQFNQPVNLRSADIVKRIDFGDASFAQTAYLNVSGLQFNAEDAKILGDPGQIGRVLSVPTLQGNETLLRNLIRNFRLLEQVPDANQVEYTTKRLQLRQLRQELLGINLNTASLMRLKQIGFSADQVAAIAKARAQQPFRSLSDIVKLDGIDLATYVKVRDRLIVSKPRSVSSWLLDALQWLTLVLLISLSRYGTSFWLVFGVGMVAIAYFGVLFWFVDRCRQLYPKLTLPSWDEVVSVWSSAGLFALIGISAIFRIADRPWITMACLGVLAVPIPALLLFLIYNRGYNYTAMNISYFVEDGSQRQLRFLIGRLPNMPRYVFFRDRFAPLLWDRRWNWLNYFDFSLNNLLKFGFNDIRLRDEEMPGLITTLSWYQWSVGILYFTLLLWTLSRTIPGLNLLIYFK